MQRTRAGDIELATDHAVPEDPAKHRIRGSDPHANG
jgi:hypothetical protein